MAVDDIFESGEGDWLKARVRGDLGGFSTQPHGKFLKKTRHQGSLLDLATLFHRAK
jgi:hypothetical protein